MKKKNLLYSLYSAAFIGMCLVPSALMPFVKADDSKEKRKAADAPKLTDEDGKLNFGFFQDFENYFSDHFAFRQQLVTADGRIKTAVFGTSPNKNVIAGKDGWLYYGETLDDYLHINTLSDRSIENIRHNLDMIYDYCTEKEIQFVFTVAPNKNSIYSQYMPSHYVSSGQSGNYERLAKTLVDTPYWVDMKLTLQNTTSGVPLYHKTDTHWNNMGAYVGHARLMAVLGKDVCPAGTSWYTKNNDRLGDLAAMIYPAEDAKDTQVYNDYQFTYSYRGAFHRLDDMTIRTVCSGKDGNLKMFRDSYGEAILPYMAECFGTAEFSRFVPYELYSVNDGAVIIEIVERNMGDLQKYAPIMQAPEADLTGIAPMPYNGDDITVETELNGGMTHIFGELPEEFFGEGFTEIYVKSGENTFRAFNCFEDKLLGRENEISDRGFSLYLSPELSPTDGHITITAVSSGGKSVSADIQL